jgi:hypothetical protein
MTSLEERLAEAVQARKDAPNSTAFTHARARERLLRTRVGPRVLEEQANGNGGPPTASQIAAKLKSASVNEPVEFEGVLAMQLADDDYAAVIGHDLVREDDPGVVASQIATHLQHRQAMQANRLNQLKALSAEVAQGLDQKNGGGTP